MQQAIYIYFSSQKFLVMPISHRNQGAGIREDLVHLMMTYNHNARLKA